MGNRNRPLTRRTVLAISAGGFSFTSSSAQEKPHLRVGGNYSRQFEDWLTRQAEGYWNQREKEIAGLDAAGIQKRQEFVRKTMLDLIGGLPEQKTPLNPKVTGGFTRENYRVENIIFESQPGFHVTGNLYIPITGHGPYPAVLGVAGHSTNGKASSTYQSAFIELAKRGFVVFAIDPPGQGERLEYFVSSIDRSVVGVGVPEHNMAGLQCLLTGHTFARYEIWDGIRAFDYLLTRPEVDPNRLAVAGNSGGGTQAAYLGVFEPRLAAVVSSCYMTRWRELWSGPGPQDAEQIFPRFIEKGLDFSDFMLADPTRPFLMTTAIQDFFPIDGARLTFRQSQRLFDLLGGGEKAGYFEYDDTHGWSRPRREAAYRWLGKWLQQSETDGKESIFQTEEESLLYATETGQLSTSISSETVRSLNQKYLSQRTPTRKALTTDLIQQAIGLKQLPEKPESLLFRREIHNSHWIEKTELFTEDRVKIPATLLVPGRLEETAKAVLFTTSFDKSADPDIQELVEAGHIVLVVDPRGIGESYQMPDRSGYTQAYQLSARAMLLGRNLVEIQTADLLAASRFLLARPECKNRPLTLYAKGETAPAALFAASLTDSIHELILERSILSYRSVVDADIHYHLERTVIPGILHSLDLPDVMKALKQKLILVSPVHPNGTPLLSSEARRVLKNYEITFTNVTRGEGWRLKSTLKNLFF